MSDEYGLSRVLLQEDWEVSGVYQVSDTPSAVLVEPDGMIGSFLAESAEDIEILIERSPRGSIAKPKAR